MTYEVRKVTDKRHQIGKKMKTRKKIYKDNNKKNGIDTFWKIIGSDRKHAQQDRKHDLQDRKHEWGKPSSTEKRNKHLPEIKL
jgi:hypothetical protein